VAVANMAAIVSRPIRIRTIMDVFPARVLGTEHRGGGPAVDAKRYRVERQGGPMLQPGFP
jgi:hypothetical protein